MKKKIIYLFSAILLAIACNDDDLKQNLDSKFDEESKISSNTAKDVALNFMNDVISIELKNSKQIELKKGSEVTEVLPFDQKFAENYFRVFQFENGGYVLVSSSKNQFPILAFSKDSKFILDDSFTKNEALQEWIKVQTEEIEYLNENPKIAENIKNSIKNDWSFYSKAPPIDEEIIVSGGTVYEEVSPKLSTTWNQGCGYNDLLSNCSSGGSCGKVWTGCVATALAQVMKYHQYPNNYNWNIMPNSYGSSETSRLMRDIGNAVDMNYGCSGSGASMNDAKNALKNNFGYSNSVSLINFDRELLSQQLKLWDNPVILSGGNHAWVCDGYKRYKHIWIHNPGSIYEYTTYEFSQYYLSMNWGWGGSFDGWYLYNDFTPGSSNYNSNKKMIIWAEP